MLKPLLVGFALALVAVASAADEDTPDKMVQDSIKARNALCDVLDTVTDKTSLEKAKPKLEALVKKNKELAVRGKKLMLDQLPKEKQAELEKQYKGELEKATKRLSAITTRLSKDKLLGAVLQVLDPDRPAPAEGIGETPADEDPEVAAYFKKKRWVLLRDRRISDGKPMVYFHIPGGFKPTEDLSLSPEDLKMIVRSKTAQFLDISEVKGMTDDGLKTLSGMARLEGITVAGEKVTDAGIKALAQCKSLESVSLFTRNVTDAGIKELAALPKLETLFVIGMKLTGSAFEAFAGSKTLQTVILEYVDGLTDEGVKHLAKLPKLNELKIGNGSGKQALTSASIKAVVAARLPARLQFDVSLMDDDLLEALVTKGWLYGPPPRRRLLGREEPKPATAAEVQRIHLDDSKVTDRGLRDVLDCTNVTELSLRRTGVTDETLKKLIGFKKLSIVTLDGTKVTAGGLGAISGLPIRRLGMPGCELTEEAFKAFRKMTALEELRLSDAKFKADWMKHMATLPKLKQLDLGQTDFDDGAVKHMLTLPALEQLTLEGTNLGDAGFQEILKLPKLRELWINRTKVSKEVYRKAKKDHPKISLSFSRYD